MGARKPRVGWRNRNYLAGLSEATEEKGLVARVSCGRRLKYRKFKHRSTPPPDPPVRAAPHHRHWIYISSTASSASPLFFHLARPSLPPPRRRRKPPAIRRDFPPPVDRPASLLYTAPFLATIALLCVSAGSWIGPRGFPRGSIKRSSGDRWMDRFFFLPFFSDRSNRILEGGRERERSIFGEDTRR